MILCSVAALAACSRKQAAAPPAPTPAAAPKPTSVEDEVLANLRATPCGTGSAAALGLPEPYLRRVADRVIRASYFERFRVIIADGKPADPVPAPAEGHTPPIVQHLAPDAQPASAYREGYPERPGFRPPSPTTVDDTLVPKDFVLQRLAKDGLLPTTAALVAELRKRSKTPDLAALEAAGLPVDWLAFFAPPGVAAGEGAQAIVVWLEGKTPADFAQASYLFRPSAFGFKVASESGESAIELLRVQLTRGDDWDRPGDGGSVDLVRQLVEKLPELPIVASLDAAQLPVLLKTARNWSFGAQNHFDLVLEPGPLAQWAQDDAKPGRDASGALLLLPRYATRGELGANFVPGETFAPAHLAQLGLRVARSPLFFQGGNLYCCTIPKSGERLLLLGEAELHRNMSLGLTQEQVLAAFRAEFGVERCVVLPAVGFHIDVELSVRAVGNELVAFVNDQATAAQMILACGLDALRAHGELSAADDGRIRAELGKKRLSEALAILTPLLEKGSSGPGQFTEALSRAFRSGPADNGAGSLLRFLSAIDYLTGLSGSAEQPGLDAHTAAYLRSFLRREHERFTLVRGLESLGMRIVPLPGWPEDQLGMTPLNGIHERNRYLLPTYGGIYSPLDDACEKILTANLGTGVEVVRIGCAESQRRSGALHCAVSAVFGPPR